MIDQELSKFFGDSIYGLRMYNDTNPKFEFYSTFGDFTDFEYYEDFPIHDVIFVEYETNAGVGKGYKKLTSGTTANLTENEVEAIRLWCVTYFDKQTSYPDISVYSYDPENNYLYQGMMPISEVKSKNYRFTTVRCDYPVAKYDELDDTWIKVKALIHTDGSYAVDPDGYCEQCVIFLSEEEWEALPPPKENVYYYRWDFTKEEWYDSRTIESMQAQYESSVNGRLNGVIDDNASYYLGITYSGTLSLLEVLYNNKSEQVNLVSNANDLYGYGTDSVLKSIEELPNDTKVTKQEDFDKKFLLEQFLNTLSVIQGQKDAWLQLPEKLKDKYDFSVPTTWDMLIKKFDNWYLKVYENKDSWN